MTRLQPGKKFEIFFLLNTIDEIVTCDTVTPWRRLVLPSEKDNPETTIDSQPPHGTVVCSQQYRWGLQGRFECCSFWNLNRHPQWSRVHQGEMCESIVVMEDARTVRTNTIVGGRCLVLFNSMSAAKDTWWRGWQVNNLRTLLSHTELLSPYSVCLHWLVWWVDRQTVSYNVYTQVDRVEAPQGTD